MVAQVENIVLNGGMIAAVAHISMITICASEPATYSLATGANTLAAGSLGAGSCFAAPSVNGSVCTMASPMINAGTISTALRNGKGHGCKNNCAF
jgi:hypothetical protein